MSTEFTLRHVESGKLFKIPSNSSLIGRSANCDITIEAETLSREHARLALVNNEVKLQDLHSTNGSFVNDTQIFEETTLKPGDTLRFGQERFSLISSDRDATVMLSRRNLESDSAMLIEDEEEADATMMIHSIDLPQGWESHGTLEESGNDTDSELIVALKKHAQKKLKHKYGLLLTLITGDGTPSVKLLSSTNEPCNWSIGRSNEAQIQIADATVSEKHARIEFSEGNWKIIDEGSRNGTVINNIKISEYAVKRALDAQIGSYTVKLDPIENN